MSRSRGRRQKRSTSGRGTAVTLGSLSHVGMVRTSNQDSYCALVGSNAPPGTDALLAVADGMGGHQGGDVASQMSIQGLVRRLSPQDGGDATLMSSSNYESHMEKVVQQINTEVRKAATQPDTQGMGSTLTVALLAAPLLSIAHVGDSRAYLLRKGNLQQLSQDHSWVAEQVAAGILTPDEAQHHPRRNILTRAIGHENKMEVDTFGVQLEEGDKLLICSDGLHSLVTDDEIGRVLAREEPQQACQTLVNRANELGGNDNTTIVIARVDRLDEAASEDNDLYQGTTLELKAPRSFAGKVASAFRKLLPF